MSFRGINTTVIQIRRQVFTEVARMAYANVKGEQANHLMRKIPYTIIPGEEGKLRKDIFLERAIVEERVRLAMGLPTRRMDEHNSVVSGLEDASIADKYYDPPLVNVIKFACNRCPEKLVKVSDLCQGCLAHPCMEVCPKKAITWESGRSIIDQDKCIKCGRCVGVCPYNAIVKTERPCAAACGMGAIHSDELGRAEIDYSKCVSCGQCLVNCPFGAIADKGQIYQLIQGFNRGDRIYALVAPAFINQFPGLASTGKLKAALKAVGFYDVVEVAIGADLCTVDEAHDFLEEVPGKLNFMATSCCPAWSMMAKTAFPDLAKNISMTMTPMVFTARMMKQKDPEARMCFIGPCAAKKLEASRRTVRSDVDFVLTFEELAGIIEAKDVDTSLLEVDEAEALHAASAAGRGFAQSGGVAKAVADKIKEWHPDMDVKIASAQGLAECKKLLMLAKAGKYNGYLLEGTPARHIAGVRPHPVPPHRRFPRARPREGLSGSHRGLCGGRGPLGRVRGVHPRRPAAAGRSRRGGFGRDHPQLGVRPRHPEGYRRQPLRGQNAPRAAGRLQEWPTGDARSLPRRPAPQAGSF